MGCKPDEEGVDYSCQEGREVGAREGVYFEDNKEGGDEISPLDK